MKFPSAVTENTITATTCPKLLFFCLTQGRFYCLGGHPSCFADLAPWSCPVRNRISGKLDWYWARPKMHLMKILVCYMKIQAIFSQLSAQIPTLKSLSSVYVGISHSCSCVLFYNIFFSEIILELVMWLRVASHCLHSDGSSMGHKTDGAFWGTWLRWLLTWAAN
jgi:hypothetical protein